ncbi:hypothetical protein BDV93DRAFT_104735 [Ceratobasidium sp. AG-I]|nr:hypothetical protein BDV93DRAFT_104735 [Ceratobasidium sp. AG-I]
MRLLMQLAASAWKALRPKLEFILNESSDQVICEESWERQLTCSRRLTDLLFNLGRILPNALSPIATALEVNAVPASVIVARIWNKLVLTAFPNLDDALKWPCMKKFVYGEYSRQGTEDRFMARLDQIPAEVQKWDKQVIADLTLLFQKGQEAKSEVDSVPLTVGNSTEPTKHLTDDMRRLLRADCVFRATKHHTLYNVFHDTSRYGVSTPLFYPDMLLTRREEAWNPEYFQPYREAGQVAKQLLRCLNMEDAAHAQLKLMGVQFICGWCSDQNPKDWMGIIGHYLEEQRRKTRLDSRTSNEHNNHLQGLGGELVDPMVFVSNSGVEVTDASNLSRLVFRKRPWAY